MGYIAINVNLYNRIRADRPSTGNVVRNAYGHLIRAPNFFQSLGWIGFRDLLEVTLTSVRH